MSSNIKFLSLVTVRWKGIILKGKFINENEELITIKLENGYNITLNKKNIEILEVREPDNNITENGLSEVSHNPSKGGVRIVGTGGTIASYVDYKTGAVKPYKNFQKMLFTDEELTSIGQIEDEILFNIFSEDMEPEYWLKMARRAYELTNENKGVVFAHGTDTMSFSASAVSFLVENNRRPIIFTGSQRSSDRPSSDAFLNLKGAIKLASSDLGEVAVVMHSGMSDDSLSIHRGVRVRKMHTSRRDAFRTINDEEIGYIDNELNIKFNNYRKIDEKEESKLYEKFERKISLIYYYPGIDFEIVIKQVENNKGIVFAGTGLGHINNKLIELISDYTEDKLIGITSQCLYGSVNLNVYATGRNLLKSGTIPLGDMLAEVAYVKMGFLLGNFQFDEAKELLVKNMRGELSDRRTK